MNLVFRATEERDLEECFALLEDGFAYDDAQRARLPAVAGRLLAEGALNSAVLEDRERPAGGRILQFGASAFVTDGFMRDLAADMRPHVGRQVVEAILAGRSPVLGLPAIRAANSRDGLNLVVLHFGLRAEDIAPEDWPAVYIRLPENFFLVHDGFNLKEIVVEMCNPQGVTFSREAGFHLRTDYADHYARLGAAPPPPGRRPHRMGITRAEGEAAPGTYIGRIFPYRRPRFYFTAGEQRLLLRALQGDTDEEAAVALHAALPTVKTRWRAIYDRVEARAPDLLPANGVRQSVRGGEKRRLLLGYLRQHLEELRPAEEPRPG